MLSEALTILCFKNQRQTLELYEGRGAYSAWLVGRNRISFLPRLSLLPWLVS